MNRRQLVSCGRGSGPGGGSTQAHGGATRPSCGEDSRQNWSATVKPDHTGPRRPLEDCEFCMLLSRCIKTPSGHFQMGSDMIQQAFKALLGCSVANRLKQARRKEPCRPLCLCTWEMLGSHPCHGDGKKKKKASKF